MDCPWSDKPELLSSVITNALPDPWKELVMGGKITLKELPTDILEKAMLEGEIAFHEGRINVAKTANGGNNKHG